MVEFIEDQSVEVVPPKWLDGQSVCLWQPYRGIRFTIAVKKQEEPTETWTRNAARVMYYYGMSTVCLLMHCCHIVRLFLCE